MYRLQFLVPGLFVLVGALAAVELPAQQLALDENMCIMCHGEPDIWEEDTRHLHVSAEHLANDIHWQKGIHCQDCHGGNPQTLELREAHAIEDGFRKIETPADIPDFCGHCHANQEYMQPLAPDAPLTVVSDFWESVHGEHLKQVGDERSANCTSCHAKHVMRAVDDPESAVRPLRLMETCGNCHQAERDELLASEHKAAGDIDAQGVASVLNCSACHGQDAHGMRPVDDLDSPVFVHNQVQVCGHCHDESLEAYKVSVHGHGLEHSGLLSTAVCANCHGGHGIFKAEDPRSKLHATQVAHTCAACHRFIEERLHKSVHGRGDGPGGAAEKPAPGGDVKRKPSCTDCHQGHDLPHPKSVAFRLQQGDRCGDCHTDLTRRFGMSLHGQLTKLGNISAAKCSDCHGAHDILRVSNANSLVSPQNRVATCRKCHPRAPANFASFDPHADYNDPERSATLHYAYAGMELLLYSVFGFFGIHTGLWFVRSWLHRWRNGKPSRLDSEQTAYVRFETMHRNLHVIVIVSFLGLAITGLPLRYSDQAWAKWLATALGGFENTSLVHRICAVLTVVYFAVHLVWIARKVIQCCAERMPWRTVLLGPDSPVPNLRDFKDLFAMIRWFVGLGPRPTYERWTYWEKFDYWAVFWGIAIIGTSGLMLWFPDFFCRFLPGWTLNVAKVIHSEEALLATGFIFAIHFFNTHLRAERFPMDMGMLTGLVSEKELEEERPEFVQRMREQGQLDQLRAAAPGNRQLWSITLSGFLALAIGLALLAGMLLALLS